MRSKTWLTRTSQALERAPLPPLQRQSMLDFVVPALLSNDFTVTNFNLLHSRETDALARALSFSCTLLPRQVENRQIRRDKSGVDIPAVNNSGATLFDLALSTNHAQIATYLSSTSGSVDRGTGRRSTTRRFLILAREDLRCDQERRDWCISGRHHRMCQENLDGGSIS
jgi:hypothetical protein